MQKFKIAPSLLSADFARLGEEAHNVLAAGADVLHFDVMDNHYVPNLTIGPLVCKSLRDYGIKADIDVHLMVKPVDTLITSFAKAGASYISFHPDASPDVSHSLRLIRDAGCKAGLALNPDVALNVVEPFLNQLDLLLIMSVFPGTAGQKFIPETIPKIAAARDMLQNLNVILSVDGGIKIDNIAAVAKAGTHLFVAGSAIFNDDDYHQVIRQMRTLIHNAVGSS